MSNLTQSVFCSFAESSFISVPTIDSGAPSVSAVEWCSSPGPLGVPKCGQREMANSQPTVASSTPASNHLLLLMLLLDESENGFVFCFSAWS